MKYKWFARFFATVFTASILLQPGNAVYAAQAQDVLIAAETESEETGAEQTEAAEETGSMDTSEEDAGQSGEGNIKMPGNGGMEEPSQESAESVSVEAGGTEAEESDEILSEGNGENIPTVNSGYSAPEGQDTAENDSKVESGEGGIVLEDSLQKNTEGSESTLADGTADNSTDAGIPVVHAEDDIASGSYGHVEWVIDSGGKLTVSGTGDYTDSYGTHRSPWYEYRLQITSAEINLAGVTNAEGMFYDCNNLLKVDTSNFDTSEVIDMSSMFQGCYNLVDLDVSHFKTDKVVDMSSMFALGNDFLESSGVIEGHVSALEVLDVSNFRTDNVRTMRRMFGGCNSLKSLDVGNFNTGNVTDMSSMFGDCSNLTNLNVGNFNTSNVTAMAYMFDHCSNLTSLDVGNFNTSNVTRMDGMFQMCSNLIGLNLGNFNTSNVTDMECMFNFCSSLKNLDVGSFDTRNVTDMDLMFQACSNLTSLNLGNFNTGNVTSMLQMFNWCNSLTSLDLRNFNTSNVTNMKIMFGGCSSLISLDLGNFNASNVTEMERIFENCSNLISINTPYNIRTSASLPTVENTVWRLSNGTEVTELPQGLDHSVTITRHNNQAEEKDIPDGAVEFNGHYYYLFDLESITDADSAISYCNGRNGYLATITSAEENDFLFQYMMSLGYENAYFGFSDRENEGEWKWLNGEEAAYTNWHAGEPNNENPAEDYAMFYFKYEDGTWNDGDFSGGTVRGGRCFICEWGAYEQETIVLLPAVKYVPYDTIIADAENQNYTVASGSLPSGLSLTADGRLCGVPTENGSFSFTVQVTNGLDGSSRETAYTLSVNENTDANFNTYADPGYELIELVPNLYFESIPDGGSQLMVSVGPFEEFTALYLDGEKLTEGVDYTAESGSTRITIQNQTLKRKDAGSHTLAMEFRTADTGALKWAAQNYIIAEGADPSTGGDNENSGNNNTGGDNSENQNNNTTAVVENTSSTVAYTVQFGDTLSKIAQRFYGSSRSWRRIYTDNAAIIRNPNRIYPGQVFIITLDQNNNAAPEVAAKANTSNTALNDSYIVVSGDNLYKIAQKVYGQGGRWNEIYQANKNIIANPGRIYAGQVLIIP